MRAVDDESARRSSSSFRADRHDGTSLAAEAKNYMYSVQPFSRVSSFVLSSMKSGWQAAMVDFSDATTSAWSFSFQQQLRKIFSDSI